MSNTFFNTELCSQINDIKNEESITDEEAFTKWVYNKILDLSPDNFDESIKIQQSTSNRISIFNIDEENEILTIAKTIYDPTNPPQITPNHITEIFDELDKLNSRYYDDKFLKEISEVLIAYTNRNFRIRVVLATNGTLTADAIDAITTKEAFYIDSDVDFQVYWLKDLEDIVKDPPTQDLKIKFKQDELFQRQEPDGKSITGTVLANEIVRIYKEHKHRLFSLNPRESLKDTTVNKEMLDTLRDQNKRAKFWKYNNGLSATCDDFEPSDTDSNTFIFKNFKIVNGRQTTGSLYQASVKNWLDDSAQVMLRVTATKSQEERENISRATNTQNQIKWSDIVSSRQELKELALKFKRDFKEFYFETQRGGFDVLVPAEKSTIIRHGVIEKEKGIRQYIAFNENPHDARQKSQQYIFRDNYQHYFSNRRPEDLIIPHIFSNILDKINQKWKKEKRNSLEARVIASRMGRYQILKFIGDAYNKLDKKEKFETSCISQFVNKQLSKLENIAEIATTQIAQAMKVEFTAEVSNKEIDDLRNLLGRTTDVAKKLLDRKDNLLKTGGIKDPLITNMRNIDQ
ncbi:MAG: AIPR family protein [Thermoproteota archaeon]